MALCLPQVNISNRIDFIRNIYNDYGVIIDTHTADGVKAAMDHSVPIYPMIVLETALTC